MNTGRKLIVLRMVSLALEEVETNKEVPDTATDFIDLVVQYGGGASITRDEVATVLSQPLQVLVESVTSKKQG